MNIYQPYMQLLFSILLCQGTKRAMVVCLRKMIICKQQQPGKQLVKLWQFQLCWREGSAGKMEECSLKMIGGSLLRCSALLSKSLDINISLGKYCAQDIFYFVWSALVTFMSAAEGQRRWVRAARKPDHKISQREIPSFFPQGKFHYGSRFVEELKSLRDHKGIYNKNNKKQAGCWLKSRWVQNLVDILRIELYSNFG